MSETTHDPYAAFADWQGWGEVFAKAQAMMAEAFADGMAKDAPFAFAPFAPFGMAGAGASDPMTMMKEGAQMWAQGLGAWGKALEDMQAAGQARDRRFAAPEWQAHPAFDTIRQSYLALSDRLLGSVDDLDGLDEGAREKLRFAARGFVEAMSPANFAMTNPEVITRTIETRGENLLKGLANLLDDLKRGQLQQSPEGAFEVGRNLATTPGKVIYETKLFQLIHYMPTTETVRAVPLVVFPPWINRFYILDLTPEKSFVRWAVGQGLSLFMVSWKSADESLADVTADDYVAAQVEAVDVIRDLLDVPSVHTIGYCVAGTTLAMTLALLAKRGEADKVKSATFFTAQVDFEDAGDLKNFLGDEVMGTLASLTADKGYLDGRVMAATFNLLRGKDLLWAYVVRKYLLGEEPAPFDLLHWNGDTTNLPAGWHRDYLQKLYRENRLVEPGGVTIDGVALDLRDVKTPAYVQAGREDHIAPPKSVWKLTRLFTGPLRFVLAGSGHIAGVVNPPAAGKYQYWTNDAPAETLEGFVAGATEHKGSWWPDWIDWLETLDGKRVPATGARVPGKGTRKAIEDAPGRYVKMR